MLMMLSMSGVRPEDAGLAEVAAATGDDELELAAA
jgi:hypothetical protein